nr:MG2 domain-containing protein [Candidatus Cloacimonadota bacterium]
SMNVKAVTLSIKHIYENNLNYFLQDYDLRSSISESGRYYYNFQRVGDEVINTKLQLGEVRNQWLLQELDLSKLIPEGEKGLYLIELSFERKDIVYRGAPAGRNDYYTNPLSQGYYYSNARIAKPVILTDIGLTLKKAADRYTVYTTDVMKAKPLSGCRVELKTYQNQLLGTQTTDGDGKAEFLVPDAEAYFVEASYNGQRAILKTNEMAWNTSTFDVEGRQYSARGIQSYFYTERGVYRPGDPINLSMIFRNQNGTLENGHPVKVEIRNPLYQLIEAKTLTDGKDGFYNYHFTTASSDPTGNWQVNIRVGGSTFYYTLRIETVVAERLKIEVQPQQEKVSAEMKNIVLDVQSNYLFGAPAAGLLCRMNAEIYKNLTLFNLPRFRTFSFDNESIDYKMIECDLAKSNLDQYGHIPVSWDLPEFNNAPTGLVAKIKTTVEESGGRSSQQDILLPIDPYDAYVGLKSDQNEWKKLGKPDQFQFILLDTAGKPLVGETVQVRIFNNQQRWWWDFDNQNRHFKNDTETELLKELNLTSQAEPE